MLRILFLLLILISSCSASDNEFITIKIGDSNIRVELADSQESRRQGLMNRSSLPLNEGMLFVFEEEQKISFWMKDTSIPLSIAYINKAGIIREIHELKPYSQKSVQSRGSVLYALEVNQGFFEKHHITVGDKVYFSP
ncbi:DUF192 domain-containing protein [Oceanispirochaeta sp.]|jgi:uncharacterized membrane protein (UPF0127 family)|uniref:DUF192 domain-containing protein n=1 Tax=Oceanispirochaeta sp. TaxID=2035350 RepID=UPI00262F2550|nr:DUF192 domain-containing protein [Oceanispirochaeta sp.]MDA3956991.1 DUF192 domain-containing protein [Oceanispirochaeta sp.]